MCRMIMMLWLCCSWGVGAADFDRTQIENRIKPFGQVNVEGETPVPKAREMAKEDAKEAVPRSAKAIYTQYCAVCHQNGLAGAPIYQNVAQWKPRLEKKSIEELTNSAVKGMNAMPAKGTCNECSAEDIRTAIEYMLPQ